MLKNVDVEKISGVNIVERRRKKKISVERRWTKKYIVEKMSVPP